MAAKKKADPKEHVVTEAEASEAGHVLAVHKEQGDEVIDYKDCPECGKRNPFRFKKCRICGTTL